MSEQTKSRKGDHIRIALEEDVDYEYNFFDDINFIHEPLSKLNYDDLDLKTKFIDHELKNPLMITAITGGYEEGGKINKKLAEACEKYGLAFGLGSQRAMIEKPELTETYKVRDVAPSIPIVGNIGAAQLISYESFQINDMLKNVDANYLAVHLNTLQELIQPEGDRNFKGLTEKIISISKEIEYPIILKETGAGITYDSVKELLSKSNKIKGVDVSGTSGTSWSKIEEFRGGKLGALGEWGNPTPYCVNSFKDSNTLVIASGGIQNGLDVAKALVLGADVAGSANPLLKSQFNGTLNEEIENWITDLKRVMMLTNSSTPKELRKSKFVISGYLKYYM
jgi:isopentenyl-diphosphate Delta-isomerase